MTHLRIPWSSHRDFLSFNAEYSMVEEDVLDLPTSTVAASKATVEQVMLSVVKAVRPELEWVVILFRLPRPHLRLPLRAAL